MRARKRAGVDREGRGASLGAVRQAAVTRRRALTLGGAVGLGALLAPAPAPGRAATRPRGFGLDVGPRDFPAGGGESRALPAPRRFDVLGLRGARARVDVRVRRRGGAWSAWIPLATHADHAPDALPGRAAPRASDPVWAGGADELQLRSARPVRSSLRVHLVSVRAPAAEAAPLARVAQAPQRGAPPPIIPREAWGGDRIIPREAASYGEVHAAFVHHTVTANAYAPGQSAGIVLAIAKYHRDTLGWNDIGYNFLVDRYGQVFEGRAGGVDQPVIGAHAQGYNRLSTGIAVLGTHDGLPIGEPALRALSQLVAWKLSLHGAPVLGTVVLESGGGPQNRFRRGAQVAFHRVCGHRDGDTTSCPGATLYGQLPVIRRRAAALAGPVARRATATFDAASTRVPYGETARFSGLVRRADGTAAAGERVLVQKRGLTRWVTITRTRTDDRGIWSASVRWRRTGVVRVRAAGITSGLATVAVLPRIEARTRARRVRVGTSVVLRGRVWPSGGVGILIERKHPDGVWRKTGAYRARVSGHDWRVSIRLLHTGLYRFTAGSGTSRAYTNAAPLFVRSVRRRRRRRS
jgi:hypothetical protein